MTFFLSVLSSFYHLRPLQMNFIKLFTKALFLLHGGQGAVCAAPVVAAIHPLLISFSFLGSWRVPPSSHKQLQSPR